MKSIFIRSIVLNLIWFVGLPAVAQTPAQSGREMRGHVFEGDQKRPVAGATVIAETASGRTEAVTDLDGAYTIVVYGATGSIKVTGKNLKEREVNFTAEDKDLDLETDYVIPPVHEEIVIRAGSIEPRINRQDDVLYKEGFPARDDQLFFQFGSGINAGQHEGGGKSLEIRRFGFNLDHGGVGPGLLVKVDNFDQNQASQGHGQGYLGQLKSLTSELIDEIQIINGPFSAQYGNFSGLGVVQVSLKESLAQTAVVRLQGGSFNSKRGLFAFSPRNGFIAYEFTRTDTPFDKPYDRDNLTGSYKFDLKDGKSLAFKFNLGRNDFFSSGQIPVELINNREIGRFGAIDGTEGGRVKTYNGSFLFKKENQDGSVLKLDALIARSLFDLYNNFTFFRDNEELGDQFNQHDSRLQQGFGAQYLKLFDLAGRKILLTAGGNYLGNQILVTLNKSFKRDPYLNVTFVNANISTYSGYVQNDLDFGRVHVNLGLRYDLFRFSVDDRNFPQFNGSTNKGEFQPKASVAYHPFQFAPFSLYFN